ncbi:hypothetical protein [Enterovirga rhinocerotis]|uniref:Uncharacterized protein n=1 Tax=Enterovirga rhinocerotis TaxID=1339210 RepID=A0A4R7C5U5_9HYPH|nr:hypothetical protein [Enterovirga rhinocerotis]TDR93453.1 hypothetical protein EV668_0714 [Enterovirga rhinocerotis]
MSETEIALARAYLSAAEQDPIAALIRSVKDLARMGRVLAGTVPGQELGREDCGDATLRSLRAIESAATATR